MKPRAEILRIADELAVKFAERAAQHDAEGTFPYENYQDIRESGYPLLPVPERYGGWGGRLLDAVMAQERLGRGDGSTALAVAMHIQTIGMAVDKGEWDESILAEVCQHIRERGALLNSCATEPELGSPSRGGRPKTSASPHPEGWIINGRKTFASMSPVLDYFVVPAALEGQDSVGRFLIPRGKGIEIAETWDSLGMRSTGSHDLIIKEVFVPHRLLVGITSAQPSDPHKAAFNPWFTLCLCGVYLGIAAAAHQVALQYAQDRVPTALGKPIAALESIQRRIGENEYDLQAARAILYNAAAAWDDHPETRDTIGPTLIVSKVFCMNAAVRVVDGAMRVAGGASMTHELPLERYYRDVRAGLYHPPSDESALPLLGRLALRQAGYTG